MRRLRKWLPLALLVAVVAGHACALGVWIRADGDATSGVCCGLALPVIEEMRERVTLAGRTGESAWHPDQGLIPLYATALFHALGRDPDTPLLAVLGAFALAQIFLFALGRELKGPWAGLLAATLMPLFPAIAFLTRRWDVQGPQLAILCAGALLAIRSRGFTRPLSTAGFVVLVTLGAMSSCRETDNILVVFALASMATGGVLRAWILRRGPRGEPVSRTRSLIGTGVVLAALVVLEFTVIHLLVPQQAHTIHPLLRYVEETGRDEFQVQLPWWHARHLTAYLAHLFWHGLTPWLAVVVAAATALFLRFGRGRAEVAAWALVPLIVLSLLPKKNFYYLAVIYPALPLMAALGIASLRRRQVAIAGALVLCALGVLFWTARSFPSGPVAGPLERWIRDPGLRASDEVFQGRARLTLELGPREDCAAEPLEGIAPPAIPGVLGDCPYTVWLQDLPREMEVPLRIASWNPSAALLTADPDGKGERIGVAIVPQGNGQVHDLPGPPMEHLGRLGFCGRKVDVYRRPESWFAQLCGPP